MEGCLWHARVYLGGMMLSHTFGSSLFQYDDIRINATLTQLNSICNEIKRQSLNKKTKDTK